MVLRQTERFSRKSFFKTLITLEPEVLHRSDASQNDHKSKGIIPVKNDLKRLGYPTFIRLSKIRLNSPNSHSQYPPKVCMLGEHKCNHTVSLAVDKVRKMGHMNMNA